MALPVIADVYRCTWHWSHASGQRAVNVTHVYAPGKTAAQVYTAMNNRVTAAMWDTVVNSASISQVDVLALDGSSTTQINLTGSPAKWAGNGGAVDFIPQVAAIVKLQTSVRGPANRGRIFLPFSSEQSCVNGAINVQAATQAAWTLFQLNMGTDGVIPCVASYRHAHQNILLQYVVELETGTQRRRQRRNR